MWYVGISVLIYVLTLKLLDYFLQSSHLCCMTQMQKLLMILNLELHFYHAVHSSENTEEQPLCRVFPLCSGTMSPCGH